ncbi:hypothetical protein J6P92_08400 [bacterium]|nr:hypothetical protein [bacterium]
MSIGFDYKKFANSLTKQAERNIPKDIALNHKREFLDRIFNFTYIAGEAFSKDDTIQDSATAKMLTQVISEWTFHKYIDLLRSNIPAMYHESILQKLGYVAYEMTREANLGKLTQDEMLKLVEAQLKKSYEKACRQLVDNGQISAEICDNALSLSNVDTMKIKKYNTHNYTVCALLFALFSVGMNIFGYDYRHLDVYNTAALVLLSMYVGFYIGIKQGVK